MKESTIRDILFKNITRIDEGLTILGKEKYIPNTLGTRSFIDLYAKDEDNCHVLIEIKKSDASSRNAIHEVVKYIEGVKRHLGARDDEIKVIIASTEWDELLVPFSRYVYDSSSVVIGKKIIFDKNGKNFKVSNIQPSKITKGREFAPWSEINYYSSKKNLKKGIKSYEKNCKIKGIKDYVLIELKNGNKSLKNARQIAQANIISAIGGGVSSPEKILNKMPVLSHMLYFSLQKLSDMECITLINNKNDENEDLYDIEGMDDRQVLEVLHETLCSQEPLPFNEYAEIGYSAKISSRILVDEKWEVDKIHRYGSFGNNTNLTDEVILHEIKGNRGESQAKYEGVVSVSNKSQLILTKKELEHCLEHNQIWNQQIRHVFDEIEKYHPKSTIHINVFNPSAGVFTIFHTASKPDGFNYTPQYSIIVKDRNKEVCTYYGSIKNHKKPKTFQSVIKDFYENDSTKLYFTSMSSAPEQRDTEILDYLGLTYFTCKILHTLKKDNFYEYINYRWVPIKKPKPFFRQLIEFYSENVDLIHRITTKIGMRWQSGIINFSSEKNVLDPLVDLDKAKKIKLHFVNAPETCDMCSCSISDDTYMIDGKISVMGGAWGCVCADCFIVFNMSVGWGNGQLYLNTKKKKKWLLVAGFPPDGFDYGK